MSGRGRAGVSEGECGRQETGSGGTNSGYLVGGWRMAKINRLETGIMNL